MSIRPLANRLARSPPPAGHTRGNTQWNQVVGAAFIVEARDIAAAIEIAKLHPTTRVPIGEELCWTLEIRPIHNFREGDR